MVHPNNRKKLEKDHAKLMKYFKMGFTNQWVSQSFIREGKVEYYGNLRHSHKMAIDKYNQELGYGIFKRPTTSF